MKLPGMGRKKLVELLVTGGSVKQLARLLHGMEILALTPQGLQSPEFSPGARFWWVESH